MQSLEAAQAFVAHNFPDCDAAFLAGSTSRGEATPTSDLDIIIVTRGVKTAYEESVTAFGWPIDVLFNSPATLVKFFQMDVQRRRPAVSHMCSQGIILKDRDGLAIQIQDEARRVLAAGPEPLPEDQLDQYRRELTNVIDDFVSSRVYGESLLMGQTLILHTIDLILASHQHWMGEGKWTLRELCDYDPVLEQQCVAAMEAFYKHGSKDELLQFGELALSMVGGPLKEGFRGKKPQMEPAIAGQVADKSK